MAVLAVSPLWIALLRDRATLECGPHFVGNVLARCNTSGENRLRIVEKSLPRDQSRTASTPPTTLLLDLNGLNCWF